MVWSRLFYFVIDCMFWVGVLCELVVNFLILCFVNEGVGVLLKCCIIYNGYY